MDLDVFGYSKKKKKKQQQQAHLPKKKIYICVKLLAGRSLAIWVL